VSDTNDPRVIGLDIASTFVVVSKFLRGEGEPFTSEDARAMAISAHMEASKKGYRSLNPAVAPKVEEKPKAAQEPQGAPQQPQSQGDYDHHNMKHVASAKSIGTLKGVMKKAAEKEAEKKEIGIRDAEVEVKKNIINAFEEEWNHTPNLVAPKGRMHQGQVSWTINYIMTEWGLE